MFCACSTGSCAISSLVGPFDRKSRDRRYVLRMPGFPPLFFLSSSTVVTWLPDVTEGHLTPSGFPWVCACATGSCATPVVTHSEVSLGCSLRRPRPIFSMVTGTSTRVQIPSFLHILYESIIGNHNIVHFIGIGSYGTEVVPKISMECCIK